MQFCQTETVIVTVFLTGLENLIQFHQTERHGLPVLLEKYISNEPPPPESRKNGRTNALHLAIEGGIEQNVINIIKHKKHPDVNSRDADGMLNILHCSNYIVCIILGIIMKMTSAVFAFV